MKKLAFAALIPFVLVACGSSGGDPIIKQGVYEGMTFEQVMRSEQIRVPENYNKQVCSYIVPLTKDGVLSDSDLLDIMTKISFDLGTDVFYATEREISNIASVIVASTLTACPNQMEYIEAAYQFVV